LFLKLLVLLFHSRECQREHWAKGHKKDCEKIVLDRALATAAHAHEAEIASLKSAFATQLNGLKAEQDLGNRIGKTNPIVSESSYSAAVAASAAESLLAARLREEEKM